MTDNPDIEVVKLMLKKGREKLETARLNFENERYDDSVSRLYYAIFHTISAVLMSKKLHFSSHKGTISSFNKEFIKAGIFPDHFSKTIQKIFIERHTGDYDFGGTIEADIAKEDIKKVEEIIEACENYLTKFYNLSKEYWQ